VPTVQGTDENNVITVDYEVNDPDEIRVKVWKIKNNIHQLKESNDFDVDDVDKIEIDAKGADDFVVNYTFIPDVIHGGYGSAGTPYNSCSQKCAQRSSREFLLAAAIGFSCVSLGSIILPRQPERSAVGRWQSVRRRC